ncbi:hypothetical protein QQF64_002887 [Cirrhinus molitorella]|uniref:Uncharacterized protein n=1 Tax=Cirrhinus molitorella TaxID=172907 RepID=A0ABR3MRE0_9TELE
MCEPQTDEQLYLPGESAHTALRRQHACGGERGEYLRRFSRSAMMLVRLRQQQQHGCQGWVGIACSGSFCLRVWRNRM